jgi:hypothetical protein
MCPSHRSFPSIVRRESGEVHCSPSCALDLAAILHGVGSEHRCLTDLECPTITHPKGYACRKICYILLEIGDCKFVTLQTPLPLFALSTGIKVGNQRARGVVEACQAGAEKGVFTTGPSRPRAWPWPQAEISWISLLTETTLLPEVCVALNTIRFNDDVLYLVSMTMHPGVGQSTERSHVFGAMSSFMPFSKICLREFRGEVFLALVNP